MQKKYMCAMMLIGYFYAAYGMDVSSKVTYIPPYVREQINEIDGWYEQELRSFQNRKGQRIDVFELNDLHERYHLSLMTAMRVLVNDTSSHNTILTKLFHFKEYCDNERRNIVQNMIKTKDMYPGPGSILFKELSFGQYLAGNQV